MSNAATKQSEFTVERTKSGKPARSLIYAARIALLDRHPFFGSLAMRFCIIETLNLPMPTTAVDSKGNFYYDPLFLAQLTVNDMMCVFAHEVMHLVQRCMQRFPDGGVHPVWNQAADDIINTILMDGGIEKHGAPSGGKSATILSDICPSEVQVEARADGTTETRYRKLLQEAKEQECPACKELEEIFKKAAGTTSDGSGEGSYDSSNPQGGGDSPTDQDGDGGQSSGSGCGKTKHTCNGNHKKLCVSGTLSSIESLSPEERADEKQKWDQAISSAYQTAKSKGNVPGYIEEMMLELAKSVVRWQDHLRKVTTKVFKNRYTHNIKNRRASSLGVRLPGLAKEGKGAAFFMDTSGSMGKKEIIQGLSEAAEVCKQSGCDKIFVAFHDTEVYHADVFDVAKLRKKIKIRPGGTSHLDCFTIIDKKHEKYEIPFQVGVAIFFTDMYSDFPDRAPSRMEVVWAIPGTDLINEWGPKWGKRISVPFQKGD